MFALIALFSGCKKSTYHQLTDEDMKWLAYKNYDVMKFANGTGDFVNYYVTLRVKSYQKDGDTYSEFTAADFVQLNDTSALVTEDTKGGIYIFKGDGGLIVSFTWPHFALKGLPLSSLPPTIVNVGGINYNDVFKIDSSGLTDLRNYIRIIWVSKSKGVLQMEDTSGNLWVREF